MRYNKRNIVYVGIYSVEHDLFIVCRCLAEFLLEYNVKIVSLSVLVALIASFT